MSKKNKKKKKHKKFWVIVKLQFAILFLIIAAIGLFYGIRNGSQIQVLRANAIKNISESTKDTFRASQTSVVYDADGNLISTLKGEKDLYYLESDKIPYFVKAAFVSIEDKKFYRHNGIDIKAIIRAAKSIVQNRAVTQGGSTITQQLSRNIFLSHEVSWERKVAEIFTALEMEKKYTKEEILEFYINNIYFSNGYYGIQAASKGYFNKDVNELTLSQMTFLCAIPNNPSLYDPVEHLKNTLKRRNRILKEMLEDNLISKDEYNQALKEEITLNRPEITKQNYVETYTYYCATRALMEERGFQFKNVFSSTSEKDSYEEEYNELYNECQQTLFTAGYRIYTSIEMDKQKELQTSVDENLAEFTTVNEGGTFELQSAATCIDNNTGLVVAIVGGRSQDTNGYTLNRAYQSFRQPGSTIKPLVVYTPILERDYTPNSTVLDAPIEDGPSNSGGSYSGSISLRRAVEKSKNTVAWRLFQELTPEVGISYLEKMNFSKLDERDKNLAASLGGFTNGVNTVEMASGYTAIENNGNFRAPTCIIKITDADGNILIQGESGERNIYQENAARMMTDVLKSVIVSGTGKGLGLSNMPSAGKTGTTNDNKDGWFVGFTRYYTTSVWVGYDMPKEIPGLFGATYPGAIWHQFMEKIHTGLESLDFVPYASYHAPTENQANVPSEQEQNTDTTKQEEVKEEEQEQEDKKDKQEEEDDKKEEEEDDKKEEESNEKEEDPKTPKDDSTNQDNSDQENPENETPKEEETNQDNEEKTPTGQENPPTNEENGNTDTNVNQ
ncbi:transglycosylase domain-containing protein [Anaerosacchariphilus polymeriproducens]|uniref:Penicillin-binding protein 1A n=1 Tax=Anaerosacchariphilus polymeriproducens TaxID=1812858 RepID=A0A371AZW1_9FIRM|nr:PBP1A family penicillin-binding protein [Anaerosacchariphilus polymeriproducens]RDU25101.1 PBP1A family penicillin-binding protein [Anaerosacchariphilus polymeriproducens]